uniref:Uncharacterized protein n=1 Tax=viral metagenome TaxID=1070528 RepID=A0A6C0JFW9_9ZZZZ
MHDTLNKDVSGFIDDFNKKDDIIQLKGWCFHKLYNNCEIRIKYKLCDDSSKELFIDNVNDNNNRRQDVINAYKFSSNDKLMCGWDFKITDKNVKNVELEMFFDEKWNTIFTFEKYFKNYIVEKKNGYIPSFVVVDNFYQDVDSVRELALLQTFEYHTEYHKGKRTDSVFRFEGLKESFESILNCKIKNWTNYGVNGCFQICVGGDQLVYHVDKQEYAGIIFLTPDAPPQTGTTFYRSKNTKKMKAPDLDFEIVFKNGYLDSTEFEVVDVIGNVYNRVVLFDSKMIHAASTYFGTNLENGRLFQLFFFDLER